MHPVHVSTISQTKASLVSFISFVAAQQEVGSWKGMAAGFTVVWMPYSHFKASIWISSLSDIMCKTECTESEGFFESHGGYHAMTAIL